MKTFKSVVIIKYPQDIVWPAMRDRLPEMVPFLDDVESITPEHREQHSDALQITNIWQADIEIPAKIQEIIDTDALRWTDNASWLEAENQCQWSIEPHFFKDRVQCSGSTLFEPAIGGRGTRITFAGELGINVKDIPGVPAFMEGTATKTMESLIITLIPKNFRKMTDALAILLEQENT